MCLKGDVVSPTRLRGDRTGNGVVRKVDEGEVDQSVEEASRDGALNVVLFLRHHTPRR